MRPAEKLVILLGDTGSFNGHSVASSVGNNYVNNLFPQLAKRLPMVFSLNGIDTVVIDHAPSSGTLSANLNDYPYLLRISPRSVTAGGNSGGNFTISLDLLNRIGTQNTLIWTGSILMGKAPGDFYEMLADECSRKILLQLNKDGIIKLADTDIKMPR
jgi:hypothetical protein